MTQYEYITTPNLHFTLCWQDTMLNSFSFSLENPPRTAMDKNSITTEYGKKISRLLHDYFNRKIADTSFIFPLPELNWKPFSALAQKALMALHNEVPFGAIETYKDLAIRAGNPNAARAMGRILSKNPWPLIIPCHRIIAANKQLRGFSAPGGLNTKAFFLELEGVEKSAYKLS